MLESWCDKNCDILLIFQAIAAQPLVRQSDKSFLKAEWKPLAEIENMRTYRSESDFLLVGILIDWNLFLIFQWSLIKNWATQESTHFLILMLTWKNVKRQNQILNIHRTVIVAYLPPLTKCHPIQCYYTTMKCSTDYGRLMLKSQIFYGQKSLPKPKTDIPFLANLSKMAEIYRQQDE